MGSGAHRLAPPCSPTRASRATGGHPECQFGVLRVAAHRNERGTPRQSRCGGAGARTRKRGPRAAHLRAGDPSGSQGAGADALAGLAAGEAAGYVVNASRSIIFAWQDTGGDYRRAAALAAESMRSDLWDNL